MKALIFPIILLAAPAIAQDRITIGSSPARPDIAPVKIRPGIDIATTPLERKTERKPVHDWPDRDLTLATPQYWSNPSRGIALNHPPSALAVERVRSPAAAPCATFHDRIDLTAVRKRGFTLVAFNAEPLPPRHGHTLQSPVEAIAVDSREGDVYTAFLDRADRIRIRPPLFVRQDGGLSTCWSGYRLTVTLEGPAGVDPFGAFRRPGHRQNR